MVNSVTGLALSFALFAGVALAQPQQPQGPGAAPGIFPNSMCWRGKEVKILFHSGLDAKLENPGNAIPPFPSIGFAKDREDTMEAVVADWNAALAGIGAVITLKLDKIAKSHFAAQQGQKDCVDPATGNDVFLPDYTKTHTDGTNAASTAQNSRNKLGGPGWVHGEGIESYRLDQRLGETKLTPPPNAIGAREIREADILAFTHLKEGNFCPAIQWNYLSPRNPAFPLPANAPYYDYYSVMLHEVGHLLGLDHQVCPQINGAPPVHNVMSESIAAGVRAHITPCEINSLRLLYAPGAPCAPGN